MFGIVRSRLLLLVRVSIVFVALLSSALFPAAGLGAAAAGTPNALTGLLTPVGTIDPIHPPAGRALPAKAPASRALPKGARSIHSRPAAAVARGALPAANSALFAGSQFGRLLQNFNGVGSLDSAVTNFGLEFEPPDQGLCVGNGFVLEAVNSAYTFYHTDGSLVAGPFNVNVLFGDGLAQFTSDPRCYYDPATNRWIAIILFISDDSTSARTDISISSSGDPTLPWTIYHLDGTDDGTNGTPSHPGCPCFGDQPLLGIDAQNVYISANEFSILGPQFNGTQLYAIAKSELVTAAPAHFVMFENLTIGGSQAATVQPAITSQGAPAEYFLNSLDPNGTGDNRLGVWALTNRGAVIAGGVPTLSSVVIGSEHYAIPPGTFQKGSSSLLDSGDDRMQQVQFINGDLWGALGTAVITPIVVGPRAGIAWFRVHPSLAGPRIASATVVNQGYLASAGNNLIYPAIEVSSQGAAAMVFTVSGPTTFASAAYAVMTDPASGFGKIKITAAGTGPYDPNATRWGDYSFATLDPSGKSFWFATEYIPPHASQTLDGLRNWGTRVFQVDARGN